MALASPPSLYYQKQKQYQKAEPLYQQALYIYEKISRLDHPERIYAVKWYASLLCQTNRKAEAESLLARINLTLDDLYS